MTASPAVMSRMQRGPVGVSIIASSGRHANAILIPAKGRAVRTSGEIRPQLQRVAAKATASEDNIRGLGFIGVTVPRIESSQGRDDCPDLRVRQARKTPARLLHPGRQKALELPARVLPSDRRPPTADARPGDGAQGVATTGTDWAAGAAPRFSRVEGAGYQT